MGIFLRDAFRVLSVVDCERLIGLWPMSRLHKSTIRTAGGWRQGEGYRTSSQAVLDEPVELCRKIVAAASKAICCDQSHFEPLTILRYSPGQFFKLHHDNPGSGRVVERMMATGGQRTHTITVAISDDYTGGDLSFPDLGTSYKLAAGYALIWSNCDRAAKHEVLPVISGVKYSVVSFVRERPYVAVAEGAYGYVSAE